jgi:malonyl-CoA O-methyltransferase
MSITVFDRWLRRWTRRPRTLSSLEAYQLWAEHYPPYAHNGLMRAEEAAMRRLLPPFQGTTVLDLACGTGRYGQIALTEGARQVIGIDNSLAMLAVHAHPLRALATTEHLPLPGQTMDLVICGLALGHLPRLQPSLDEISRVLKSTGTAVISDFHPFMFLSGGQRTFATSDGRQYAVEHYPHLYADYHTAARTAGLHIVDVIEEVLPEAPSPAPAVIVYALHR